MNARVKVSLATLAVVALSSAACSGDDDAAATVVTSTTVQPDPASAGSAPATEAVPGSAAGSEVDTTTTLAVPIGSESPGTLDPTATTAPIEIPATGVPGLDSADRFCAAWSRFGGSWQVLLVGSTFLDDPETVARWEVAAASLIESSYDELLINLPGELATEGEDLANGYFGALDRRSQAARMALAVSGATDADLRRLQQVWTEALATRDPSTPEIAFVVPDDLVDLVDAAAAQLMEARVEFHLDPSMVVDVETPLTDAYIESTCPDRGTLTGQEIDPAEER